VDDPMGNDCVLVDPASAAPDAGAVAADGAEMSVGSDEAVFAAMSGGA